MEERLEQQCVALALRLERIAMAAERLSVCLEQAAGETGRRTRESCLEDLSPKGRGLKGRVAAILSPRRKRLALKLWSRGRKAAEESQTPEASREAKNLQLVRDLQLSISQTWAGVLECMRSIQETKRASPKLPRAQAKDPEGRWKQLASPNQRGEWPDLVLQNGVGQRPKAVAEPTARTLRRQLQGEKGNVPAVWVAPQTEAVEAERATPETQRPQTPRVPRTPKTEGFTASADPTTKESKLESQGKGGKCSAALVSALKGTKEAGSAIPNTQQPQTRPVYRAVRLDATTAKKEDCTTPAAAPASAPGGEPSQQADKQQEQDFSNSQVTLSTGQIIGSKPNNGGEKILPEVRPASWNGPPAMVSNAKPFFGTRWIAPVLPRARGWGNGIQSQTRDSANSPKGGMLCQTPEPEATGQKERKKGPSPETREPQPKQLTWPSGPKQKLPPDKEQCQPQVRQIEVGVDPDVTDQSSQMPPTPPPSPGPPEGPMRFPQWWQTLSRRRERWSRPASPDGTGDLSATAAFISQGFNLRWRDSQAAAQTTTGDVGLLTMPALTPRATSLTADVDRSLKGGEDVPDDPVPAKGQGVGGNEGPQHEITMSHPTGEIIPVGRGFPEPNESESEALESKGPCSVNMSVNAFKASCCKRLEAKLNENLEVQNVMPIELQNLGHDMLQLKSTSRETVTKPGETNGGACPGTRSNPEGGEIAISPMGERRPELPPETSSICRRIDGASKVALEHSQDPGAFGRFQTGQNQRAETLNVGVARRLNHASSSAFETVGQEFIFYRETKTKLPTKRMPDHHQPVLAQMEDRAANRGRASIKPQKVLSCLPPDVPVAFASRGKRVLKLPPAFLQPKSEKEQLERRAAWLKYGLSGGGKAQKGSEDLSALGTVAPDAVHPIRPKDLEIAKKRLIKCKKQMAPHCKDNFCNVGHWVNTASDYG